MIKEMGEMGEEMGKEGNGKREQGLEEGGEGRRARRWIGGNEERGDWGIGQNKGESEKREVDEGEGRRGDGSDMNEDGKK